MIKLGYSEPTLTEETVSDGSKVYGVFISGDYDLQIQCVDQSAAENLIKVWHHGVVDVEVTSCYKQS